MTCSVARLMDAIDAFDMSRGVKFETYCVPRIRGAMLDELRGNDWMSRGDRRHQRSIEAAVRTLEQRLGVRLLTTDDPAKARALAEELDRLNEERRTIEAAVQVRQHRKQV